MKLHKPLLRIYKAYIAEYGGAIKRLDKLRKNAVCVCVDVCVRAYVCVGGVLGVGVGE